MRAPKPIIASAGALPGNPFDRMKTLLLWPTSAARRRFEKALRCQPGDAEGKRFGGSRRTANRGHATSGINQTRFKVAPSRATSRRPSGMLTFLIFLGEPLSFFGALPLPETVSLCPKTPRANPIEHRKIFLADTDIAVVLKGYPGLWRLRVASSYRVVYRLDDR